MDYWSRIILTTITGVGVGLAIAYFMGNPIIWVFASLAIALATETTLRTVKNVKAPPNPVLDSRRNDPVINKKPQPKKPKKPNF